MADGERSTEEMVQLLEEQLNDLEAEIIRLRNQLGSRKEDLDTASDSLVNSLQMLKTLEAQLMVEKSRYEESGINQEEISEGPPGLEVLMEISRKPWQSSGSTLAELGFLATEMSKIQRKLEDPLLSQRRKLRETKEKQTIQLPATKSLDSVDIVLDEGDRAVVTVSVSETLSFIALLEYAAQYWSLDQASFSIFDSKGVCWPLHANVRDTLKTSSERVLYLRKSAIKVKNSEDTRKSSRTDGELEDLERDIMAARNVRSVSEDPEERRGSEADESVERGTVRFADDMEATQTKQMQAEIEKANLEHKFKRGYRFSMSIVRYHCETFFFLLLLTLVFNYAFFSRGSYEAQPLRGALERAFVYTPFSACVDCQDEVNPVLIRDVLSVASDEAMYAYLLGPVQTLLTVPSDQGNTGSGYSLLPIVQQYNVLPAKVQLQQLRVDTTCTNLEMFGEVFSGCAPSYLEGGASTSSYGAAGSGLPVESAFVFGESDESLWPPFSAGSIVGIGDRFKLNGGGFFYEPSMVQSEFEAEIRSLRANNWTDGQTRAVFLTVVLYNPNIDIFLVYMASFQFTTANGIIARFFMTPVELRSGSSGNVEESLLLTSLVLYCIFLVLVLTDFYYAESKVAFMRRPETLIEVVLFILVVLAASFSAILENTMEAASSAMDSGLGSINKAFVDLRGVAFGVSTVRGIEGALGVFLALKGVSYLRMNPHVSFLGNSFLKTLDMANNFTFVWIMFLLAFTAAAHYTMGRDEFIFHSFDISLVVTVEIMLGSFDWTRLGMLSATRAWPVIYGLVVFFISYFGLYRVYIAIVSFSYSKSMDKVRKHGYYWLPSVNQEYRINPPTDSKAVRKLRVASRFGLEDTS